MSESRNGNPPEVEDTTKEGSDALDAELSAPFERIGDDGFMEPESNQPVTIPGMARIK